ncbi:E3 ubiquitin-protein ligase At1g12760 [Selaginella moellendorffii]|uniref:E3 ubiquitin-protein ligase At1g12760 n=1 Tax=Selaginella moellendorffii TaxID=88036 RepID=UPI000D1C9F1E|nr:E3 ubiquitin-protein ligase At1g12760 [Selaginella moellendorffii]|eukprot:XP_024530267.1 E3 ubiquitin-protein ligase At1g12760 [Selaginella moellendorffii]
MESGDSVLHFPPGSTPAVIVDMSPLLGAGTSSSGSGEEEWRRSSGRGRIQGAARFFRHAGSGRVMRESSILVRETAVEQLDERQSDWAYSRPVVVLDLIWNLAFVTVALVVLVISQSEQPCTPLRIWVLGYALQCVLHMSCVVSEYRRRRRRRSSGAGMELEDMEDNEIDHISLAKRLESANTMFSFVWWVVGFYWITAGSEALVQSSPRVYWLCIVFLAFDVFFVVFCVALACMIGIAVCCCLPCIIAILYAVVDQEGASEEDISVLPTLKFKRVKSPSCSSTKPDEEDKAALPAGGVMCSSESLFQRMLSAEDAECCICLSSYEDDAELRELPCNHHFHGSCIVKWLRINATCPLCKYNIIHRSSSSSRRSDSIGGEDEV